MKNVDAAAAGKVMAVKEDMVELVDASAAARANDAASTPKTRR
ncbi:hypothetical protein J2S70_001551 [Trueperella bonasi]|uniref:Uncharacterized protein n=1 Tax=Trueperella bonasi TaxID=312286 RepID=A0ABT9NI04_9ACTO|nr:hypothetical protein [Trueperella bonasi]MDP9806969.1 hypothetical protein [Trueperella bonasi]